MATIAENSLSAGRRTDLLSGTPRAGVIDRWIYVFTAATFIVVTLIGFIPDSIMKLAQVRAGERPAFPMVLHMHAVLMGSFLLLLLAQTVLMATGRAANHRRLGVAALAVAGTLVVVGIILASTMYHMAWQAAQDALPQKREAAQQLVSLKENILLLQVSAGTLFTLFLTIGARARGRDAGLHKRMMMLAPAVTLLASIDRMWWLPSTFPASPMSSDFYMLVPIAPMFAWDVIRNKSVHRAYLIWLAFVVPMDIAVDMLWDTPGWHHAARAIMGV